MSSHWLIAPIVLPLLVALLLIAARPSMGWQRLIGIGATLALVAVALVLISIAADGEVRVYRLGDWPGPYGIVLMLDRLSALMVLLTAAVALPSLWYAARGADSAGRHFHALFQLQLMGVNGAFLTGDLFNLFVFFEVLLIASYGLLLFGGGAARSRAGLHYVVLNLVGSSLFLIAVGLIYGAAGSLNMADLALRISQAPPEATTLLRVGAFLLVVVFGLKAAVVPLAFWLPSAYAAASAPVAALFAIMTKVGVYAMLRVLTLVFGLGEGKLISAAIADWLLPAGLLTLLVGNAGALVQTHLRRQIGYLLIGSIGTILLVLASLNGPGIAGGLYYLVHSTLVAAALFLVADLIAAQRGRLGDRLESAPPVAQTTVLALLFFAGAVAYAGLPPFSGFVGKLIVLQAVGDQALAAWIWAVVLVTSLFAVIALARAGSTLFWKALAGPSGGAPASRTALLPVILLMATSPALVAFAGPLVEYATATARQLQQPELYIERVLSTTIAQR